MIAYYKDNYKSIEIFPPDQIKTDYRNVSGSMGNS